MNVYEFECLAEALDPCEERLVALDESRNNESYAKAYGTAGNQQRWSGVLKSRNRVQDAGQTQAKDASPRIAIKRGMLSIMSETRSGARHGRC